MQGPQRLVVAPHCGTGFAHWEFSEQTQLPVAESQISPAAQRAESPAAHWTQRPVDTLQTGVPGWSVQPESDVQGTQEPPTQEGAAGLVQSAFETHATHSSRLVSQRGVAPVQAAELVPVHWTQRPWAASQASVPAWPAQSGSVAQGTQTWFFVSQVGLGFTHWEFPVQPQLRVAALQLSPVAQAVALPEVHWTQRPEARSQAGVSG